MKAPEIKQSTHLKYTVTIQKLVIPRLGQFYLEALTPVLITEWVRGLTADGYAGWTVVNVLRLMRTLPRDAMAHHPAQIKHWPCERVRPPRTKQLVGDDRNMLSAEELALVLEKVRQMDPYWYAATVTTAFTGLRWGEVTALRWEDLDHEAGVIRVRRNNFRGTIDTTKTGREREVPLMPRVEAVLEEHRVWLESRRTVRDGGAKLQYQGYLAG
jgi:integrase